MQVSEAAAYHLKSGPGIGLGAWKFRLKDIIAFIALLNYDVPRGSTVSP
jgi:hypothetical protein